MLSDGLLRHGVPSPRTLYRSVLEMLELLPKALKLSDQGSVTHSLTWTTKVKLQIRYQITISEAHPVKAAGITELMLACRWKELSLVFVVPSDKFKSFQVQRIDGRIDANLDVVQYAMCIDLEEYCQPQK